MKKEYIEQRNRRHYVARAGISPDSIVPCFNERLSPEGIPEKFDTLVPCRIFGAITFDLQSQPAIDADRTRLMYRFEARGQNSALRGDTRLVPGPEQQQL